MIDASLYLSGLDSKVPQRLYVADLLIYSLYLIFVP
jgi:hypothetical protein